MAETEIKSINGKTIADVSARNNKLDKNQGTENAGKILGIGVDGNVVPQKPVQALAGASAPTTTTAGVVGQEYYVIVGNAVTEMYVCTAVANGTYTWDKVEFGGAGMDITGAKVGQIAKIKAVDSAGKPTAWEAVDMREGDSGGLRNIDLIVNHIVTAEEVTARFLTWDTTTIPELSKYNLFYAVISSQTEFGFNKWVKFYINNIYSGAVAGFNGMSSPKVKKLPISVNRYFGRWIGTSVYNPINSSIFPLIVGECEMNLNEPTNNTNADATLIGIGSYAADFGLTEGMSIKIYAMV